MQYATSSHCVYYHRYHIVWATKYRYKVLFGDVRLKARDICRQVCNENGVEILHGVLSRDHVHMFVSVPPGSVIVLDNATFHKRQDTQTMIAHAGHILEYLPPYSPDLNPIEHKSAQAKTIKRKTGTSGDEIFRQKFRSRLQSSCYRMVARHR